MCRSLTPNSCAACSGVSKPFRKFFNTRSRTFSRSIMVRTFYNLRPKIHLRNRDILMWHKEMGHFSVAENASQFPCAYWHVWLYYNFVKHPGFR